MHGSTVCDMREHAKTTENTGERSYSTTEVAVMFGVTRPTVRRWITSGRLHAFDIGSGRARLRVTGAAMEAFIKVNRIDAPPVRVGAR